MRIDIKNLTNLLPCVLRTKVRLERHSQVLVTLLVGPSDDRLALAIVLDVRLYNLVLKKVDRAVLLLQERHLVLLNLRNIIDPEVTGSEIMPPSIAVKCV